jgi:flagellar biosynthesis protein FliR
MEATIQSSHSISSRTKTNISAYQALIEKLNFSYFGLISMTILIGSCLGGIAAMYILKEDAPIWQLALCMGVSMANNVAAISQAPTKWVVNSFIIGFVVNIILIVINII